MPTIEELGQKVKAKYPGQYDDLSDTDVGKKVKAKYPTEYSDFTEATRTAPRNSLKGGPANMPADENNPAQKGFMSSLLDAVTAPYELVRGLVSGETKLSDVPRGMLEGAGNTIVKVGSGNLAGAAGDIVGGAIVGKLAGAAGKGAAAVAPESAAAVARPVLTTASKVAKNPLARDVLGVVSPRAGKVIDAISRIKKSIEAQKATPVAPAEVPGVPPEQYYATAPATPETPAPGMAPAAGSDYLMPEPAQIPANASPAQLAQFPPQTVIDYLQGQGKPAAETPAEVAAAPAKEVAKSYTSPYNSDSHYLTSKPDLEYYIEKNLKGNPNVQQDSIKISGNENVGYTAKWNNNPTAGASPTEVAKRSTKKPEVSVIPAPEPAVPKEVYETAARSAKAGKVASLLNKYGITSEYAALMGDPEWAQLEQAAGVEKLSAEARKVALEQLKKLEAPKTAASVPEALEKNPKAMDIAQQLAAEMNAPEPAATPKPKRAPKPRASAPVAEVAQQPTVRPTTTTPTEKVSTEWLKMGRNIGKFDPMDTESVSKIGSNIADDVATNQWDPRHDGPPTALETFEREAKKKGIYRAEYTDAEWQHQFEAFKKSISERLKDYE